MLYRDDVETVIEAVQDLLWLFDYYSGHDWALNHLSYERGVELNVWEPYND